MTAALAEDEVRYSLSVHDLLSCFAEWREHRAVSPATKPVNQPSALVMDRHFGGEGLSLAWHNGTHYQFCDGDCFARIDDTLDECDAEFLTDCQLQERLRLLDTLAGDGALHAVGQELATLSGALMLAKQGIDEAVEQLNSIGTALDRT